MLTPDPSAIPIAVVIQNADGPMAIYLIALAIFVMVALSLLVVAAFGIFASTGGRA